VSTSDPKPPEGPPPPSDDASTPTAVPAAVDEAADVVAANPKPAMLGEVLPPKLPETPEGKPFETSGSIDVAISGPNASGSIEIAVSGPTLPKPDEPSASGSINIALSNPRLPDGVPVEEASALDSAPVSSGRITSMSVAATGPTETRSKRITEAAKDTLDKGVTRIGSGIEHFGEGVSKLAERSKKVPIVGSGAAMLGEGISSVGESLTELPRAVRTRRGRLLVRSLLVGFLLVFSWIAIIVVLQVRGTDAPDFRPEAEHILLELSKGSAAIDQVYEQASPRFQEMVRKERFVDDMTDLTATVGKFKEITAINETLVTSGPTGRIGRVSLTVEFEKGRTRASVSLHWDQGQWKLFGVGVEVPPEVKVTQAQREERVQACKDSMDSKRCEVHVAANHILEQLRDGQGDKVWDEASPIFQKQEAKGRFLQIQIEHAAVLGDYRRIIAVTEAKVIGGTSATFDVLTEYARSNVRAIFGFVRLSKTEPWKLRSLKIVLPMPRAEELARGSAVGPPVIPPTGAGSGSGSATGSARPPVIKKPPTGSARPPIRAGSGSGSTGSGSANGSGSAANSGSATGSNSGSGSGSATGPGSGSSAPAGSTIGSGSGS
jgi:hypothetical protein